MFYSHLYLLLSFCHVLSWSFSLSLLPLFLLWWWSPTLSTISIVRQIGTTNFTFQEFFAQCTHLVNIDFIGAPYIGNFGDNLSYGPTPFEFCVATVAHKNRPTVDHNGCQMDHLKSTGTEILEKSVIVIDALQSHVTRHTVHHIVSLAMPLYFRDVKLGDRILGKHIKVANHNGLLPERNDKEHAVALDAVNWYARWCAEQLCLF